MRGERSKSPTQESGIPLNGSWTFRELSTHTGLSVSRLRNLADEGWLEVNKLHYPMRVVGGIIPYSIPLWRKQVQDMIASCSKPHYVGFEDGKTVSVLRGGKKAYISYSPDAEEAETDLDLLSSWLEVDRDGRSMLANIPRRVKASRIKKTKTPAKTAR